MWNWIKEHRANLTVAFSAIAALAATLGVINHSINQIHYRFDDMNQRIDDFRVEINQRFDAQDKYINQRFDAVDQRFDAQDKYINQRFDAQDKYINQRFDAQDTRIEDLANAVSELHKLSERVSRNEGQIDVIRQQLQTADAPSP